MLFRVRQFFRSLICFSILLIPVLQTGCGERRLPEPLIAASPADEPDSTKDPILVIRDNPDSIQAAEAHYTLGIAAIQSNNQSDALNHFTHAAAIPGTQPWNVAARIELADLSAEDSSLKAQHLNEAIQNLDATKEPDKSFILRALYYLAENCFDRSEWDGVLAHLQQSGPKSSATDDQFRFDQIKGIALARTGQIQDALHTLEPLLNAEPRYYIEGILEFLRLLTEAGQIDEAVQEAMVQLDRYEDPRLTEETENLLHIHSDPAFLQTLAITYPDGYQSFLIRKELISRLIDDGSLADAAIALSELDRLYPDYEQILKQTRAALSQSMNVIPENIGLLIPLSGNLASMGHSVLRGAQLALVDYQQAQGAIPFSLCVMDSGDSKESVINGFEDLAFRQNVMAIIGPVRSVMTEELLPLCDANRMVLITPGSPKEGVTAGSQWAFRLYPSTIYEIENLIRFSVRDLGIYRFACLFPNNEYGTDAKKAMEAVLLEESAELTFSREYSRDLNTISSLLAPLSDSTAELIIIPDDAERAALIAGHIRAREILTPTIAGIGAWESDSLLSIGGNNLDGSFFAASYPSSHGLRREISERYTSKFGESPDAFALRAYEATYLFIYAIESGVRNRSHLKNWLQSSDVMPGLDGPSRFSQTGEYLTPVTIYRVQRSGYEPWRVIPVGLGTDHPLNPESQPDSSDPEHLPEESLHPPLAPYPNRNP